MLLVLALAASACRTARPEDAAEQLEAQNRLWYDSAGQGARCEPTPASCPGFKDEKAFIDACVDKGFQAKSCGCALRCSGKIDFKAPPELALAAPGATAPEVGCTAHDRELIDRLAPHRPARNARDRCLDAYVCHGVAESCSDGDAADARRLRAMAAKACEREVVAGVCVDEAVDSFACADDVVKRASAEWTRVDEGRLDATDRRCLRNVLCNDNAGGCSDAAQASARTLKREVERPGCEYWIRKFCALGRPTR
jgi:hypothetical protein